MKSTDPVFFLSEKVPKNAEFHVDSKSVRKIVRNALKKNYKPNKFDEFEKKDFDLCASNLFV
jgi:hypothetical protein